MKKTLLAMAAMLVAVTSFAAPTAEEVAALSLRIDKVDGATVNVRNSSDLTAVLNDNGSISLNNFEGYSALRVFLNEDGTVYVPSQTFMLMDEETYETVFYLTVPAASKGKSPMEAYSDRITGTYENGKLTLDAWNCIKTNSSFSENLGNLYPADVTTMVVAPNAQVTAGYWVDNYDNNWDFEGWTKGEMTQSAKNAYVEQVGKDVYVYNFDDIYGTAKFEIGGSKKKLYADPEFVSFKRVSSSGKQTDYKLQAIPEELTEEDVTPLQDAVEGTITDPTHISWANCGQFDANEIFNGSLIYGIEVVLDNPLDLTTTAIDTVAGEKQAAGVKYVNLMGVESSVPFQGVNIVVTTYTDGTHSAVKQIMK